jgi:hypothetical protein
MYGAWCMALGVWIVSTSFDLTITATIAATIVAFIAEQRLVRQFLSP